MRAISISTISFITIKSDSHSASAEKKQRRDETCEMLGYDGRSAETFLPSELCIIPSSCLESIYN